MAMNNPWVLSGLLVCSYVGKNISVLNGSHEVAAFSGIALF